MDITPRDKDLLIRTVIGEAADEPDAGKAGVAYSVLNRLNDGGYGDSIPDVLFKPKQYEPWDTKPKELMSYSPDSPVYQNAAKVVDGVLSGDIQDPTNGATHFANVGIVKQRGNNSALKWINNMQNVSQIGSHTFGNADGPPKMKKNDPLAGIDINSLSQKYGTDADTNVSPAPGKPLKITVPLDPLKGIDIDTLASKYGNADAEAQPSLTTNGPQPIANTGADGTIGNIEAGVKQGLNDVINTGAQGIGFVDKNVSNLIEGNSPTLSSLITGETPMSSGAKRAQDFQNRLDAENADFEKNHGDSTAASIGRTGGQLLATAPLMEAAIPARLAGAFGALPTVLKTGEKVAAPLINRLGAGAGEAAVGGGIFGGATSASNNKSLAENVGEGAITGALTGPLVIGASALAKGAGSKLIGSINQKTADLAKRAEELGINLKASQVSPNQTFKKVDQISGMLPFSGAQGVSDKQAGQFTRAVSRTFGEDTDEITPELVEAARKRIGNDIGSVGQNATIKADPQLAQDLHTIMTDAHGVVSQSELKPIAQNIQNIIDKVDNGEISGDAYTHLTNYKATLSKAQNSSNPNIRQFANDIRGALDDALTRHVSPSEKAKLMQARQQYKAVMTVKKLAEADPGGNISPLKLMQKVMQSPGGKLRSGDLGELADIGRKFFPQPADSGTPLGNAIMSAAPVIHHPISAMIAGATSLLSGAPLAHTLEGAIGLGANRLMREGMNSKAVTRALIRSGTGETHGATNKLGEFIAPYSAALLPKDKNRLMITDGRKQ